MKVAFTRTILGMVVTQDNLIPNTWWSGHRSTPLPRSQGCQRPPPPTEPGQRNFHLPPSLYGSEAPGFSAARATLAVPTSSAHSDQDPTGPSEMARNLDLANPMINFFF